MKNTIITIEEEKVAQLAREYFIRSSGLDREGEKFDKMRIQADKVHREIVERVDIKAIVSYFDQFTLKDSTLTIDGRDFECNPFFLIKPEEIKGAYVYVLTGGDYYLEDREIMDQLFADIWGTSYVDAGRCALDQCVLEEYFSSHPEEKREDVLISDSFGPGYYGMETGNTRRIFEILDAAEIGVDCRQSGVMVPLKSCTGIYLVVKAGTELPSIECEDCLGHNISCNMCNVRGK